MHVIYHYTYQYIHVKKSEFSIFSFYYSYCYTNTLMTTRHYYHLIKKYDILLCIFKNNVFMYNYNNIIYYVRIRFWNYNVVISIYFNKQYNYSYTVVTIVRHEDDVLCLIYLFMFGQCNYVLCSKAFAIKYNCIYYYSCDITTEWIELNVKISL